MESAMIENDTECNDAPKSKSIKSNKSKPRSKSQQHKNQNQNHCVVSHPNKAPKNELDQKEPPKSKLPKPPIKNGKVKNGQNGQKSPSISKKVKVQKKNGYNKSKNKNGKIDGATASIQRWIAKRTKRDILFLLASISGQNMKVYSRQPPYVKQRACRISMDGVYLSMGEECLHLDKCMEVSLGIDTCYADVKFILKQFGVDPRKQCAKLNGDIAKRVDSRPHHFHLTVGNGFGAGGYQTMSLSRKNKKGGGSVPMSGSFRGTQTQNMHSTFYKLPKSYKINSRNAMKGHSMKAKHCITVHHPELKKTLIFEFPNVSDRQLWVRGLCHLKNLNNKARNFRVGVVAYLISKYASTLNAHTKRSVKQTPSSKIRRAYLTSKGKDAKHAKMAKHAKLTGVPCYFEPFRQLYDVWKTKEVGSFERKYPRKYQELYDRRRKRIMRSDTNPEEFQKFAENDIVFDPNKVKPLPEDDEKFYE